MKPISLLIRLFVPVFLISVFACKRQRDPDPSVCRLSSATDQLMEANGRLTDEMQRTFLYTNAILTSVSERSTNQEAGFLVEYTDQRIVRATSGTAVITLGYLSTTSQPSSATFSQGGKVASTFVMEYTAAGRMSRIVESRSVLPLNSLTIERAFTFTYDNAGNLTNERVRFSLINNTVSEQETEYTATAKPSPYSYFPERSLLTVVALSQAVETRPGRFWHLNEPLSYKSYNLLSTGNRGNLRESATFAAAYDADSKLMNQDQNALLYQLSVPEPITKKNRQSFVYQCD